MTAAHAAGHAGEHGPALVALLYLPVVLLTFLVAVDLAGRYGVALARRLLEGRERLTPAQNFVLLLLLVSATVHLSLVPSHGDEPVTAFLFTLDGLAEIGVCAWACLLPHWRGAAALLMAGNLLAYTGYVVAGLETPEGMGLVTKAVELLALALVLLPTEMSRPSRKEVAVS